MRHHHIESESILFSLMLLFMRQSPAFKGNAKVIPSNIVALQSLAEFRTAATPLLLWFQVSRLGSCQEFSSNFVLFHVRSFENVAIRHAKFLLAMYEERWLVDFNK